VTAYLESKAAISPDGLHRYSLLRRWAPGRLLVGILHNPSTASADLDDNTVRRLVGFARALGFGALEMGNLGSFRATDKKHFFAAADPLGGPLNDHALHGLMARADQVIAAWGFLPKNPPWLRKQADHVLELLTATRDVYALRITSSGFPEHPLYLPGDLKPVLYRARRKAA
jgi:hypothetical protein